MTKLYERVVFVKSKAEADKLVNQFNSIKSDPMSEISYKFFEPVKHFEITAKTTKIDFIKCDKFFTDAGFIQVIKLEETEY